MMTQDDLGRTRKCQIDHMEMLLQRTRLSSPLMREMVIDMPSAS